MFSRTQIEQELSAIAKAVLHTDTLKPKQSLFEQGLTSIGALEIHARIEKRFQTSLQSTTLFDYPTITALGTFLHQRFGVASSKSLAAAAPTPARAAQPLDDAMVREILKRSFKV